MAEIHTEDVVGFRSYTLSKEVTVREYRGKSLVDALNMYTDKYPPLSCPSGHGTQITV